MYTFSKEPNPENRHDLTTVLVAAPSDITIDNLCETFTTFLKATNFSVDGQRAVLINEDDELTKPEKAARELYKLLDRAVSDHSEVARMEINQTLKHLRQEGTLDFLDLD